MLPRHSADAIMAARLPQQSLNRLQIPPSSPQLNQSTDAQSSSSNSTDDSKDSPVVSPRTLYADVLRDRPHTTQSLPGGSARYRHKDMREIMGETDESDFDALPLAVRRKYFSTLERLRFAQRSGCVNSTENGGRATRRTSLADRRGLKVPFIEPHHRYRWSATNPSQRLRKRRQQSLLDGEASWYLSLPDSIRKKQFSREEQELIAARLGESIIFDAADEAVYRAARQANQGLSVLRSPSVASSRSSMMSPQDKRRSNASNDMVTAMYETFRWMDEEEDLDLRLCLDDYHANLDGVVIPSPTSSRRPSFRRHLSISKIPFGRSSLSFSQHPAPSAKAQKVSGMPTRTIVKSPSQPASVTHSRQVSRTTSMTSARHVVKGSTSSIDRSVTHYQNPEARLKLRVYLASPQKFDEAIEFGFPSLDGVADGANKENSPPRGRNEGGSNSMDKCPTFLYDDTNSLFEDDSSMADPESPLTPYDGDMSAPHFQRRSSSSNNVAKVGKSSGDYSHLGLHKPIMHRPTDSYTQGLAGQREMTLRMTLTRPDLRSDETALYGWQSQVQSPSLPSVPKKQARESIAPTGMDALLLPDEKAELRGPLGGPDGWEPLEKEDGMVKRLWNKVRRNA